MLSEYIAITTLNKTLPQTRPDVRACQVASVMPKSTAPGTVAYQAPLSVGFSTQEH